jgi:hypothetical protein
MAEKRRLVETITDPAYVEGLGDRPMDQLRAMRAECREGEMELSFERRLIQGRSDILSAELDRRSGKIEGDLLSRLPSILASEGGRSDGLLPSRAPDFSIPRNADIPRRRVEEIVGEQTLTRVPQLAEQEIKQIMLSLADYEQQVSAKRKAVQDVMDEVQGEIVRRYTSGEADPRKLSAG